MGMNQESDPVRPHSLVAGFLSYLVPGLGQIYQGRTGKGILFLVCLLSLFHVGEAMGNWQNVYVPKDDNPDAPRRGANPLAPVINVFRQRWHFAGQFWIGVAAWPAVLQFYGSPPISKDVSPFLHDYQKEPNETQVNEFLVNSDKTPDLGWIYTVIAGMLNILVIYDAYAGPAYGSRMSRDGRSIAPVREAPSS
jgi:hypothetical protein